MSANGHLKFQGTNRATFVGTTSNIMFDTTSTSLGIGVTGTDHPSSNLYVTGNAYVSSNIAVGGVLTMGTVNVVARHDLEAVTALGNTTPVTLEFTNPTTSLVASGNVVVTGNVTADHFVGDGSNITGISSTLQAITDSGNVTSNTVQFTNPTTSLVASGNVVVTGNVTADHFVGDGSNITGISSTLQAITDSGPGANVTSNTVQFSNATTGFVTTANVEVGGIIVSTNKSASGGTESTVGSDKLHQFTTAGMFSVTGADTSVEFLIIGGGGGGRRWWRSGTICLRDDNITERCVPNYGRKGRIRRVSARK